MQVVKSGRLIVFDGPLQGFLPPLLLFIIREIPPEFARNLAIISHLCIGIIGLNLVLSGHHEDEERREGLLLTLRSVLITLSLRASRLGCGLLRIPSLLVRR